MRIDASNLLLAAQIQPQRPGPAVKAPQAPSFEPLEFGKLAAAREGRQAALPGPLSRPGTQLDIKV